VIRRHSKPTPLTAACCRDWNPAVDKHLPVKYDVNSFKQGKAACKKALQEELGLPVNPDIPLIAFIGRLDYQKGADIVLQVRGRDKFLACDVMAYAAVAYLHNKHSRIVVRILNAPKHGRFFKGES
jgi:hypothetical protein